MSANSSIRFWVNYYKNDVAYASILLISHFHEINCDDLEKVINEEWGHEVKILGDPVLYHDWKAFRNCVAKLIIMYIHGNPDCTHPKPKHRQSCGKCVFKNCDYDAQIEIIEEWIEINIDVLETGFVTGAYLK